MTHILLFLAFFPVLAASAEQVHSVAVAGQVREGVTGGPVSEATVELHDMGTSQRRNTVADTAGTFRFEEAVSGRDYTLRVLAPGFEPLAREIRAGASERFDLQLTIAKHVDQIVVVEMAPLVSANQEISQTVDSRTVRELPVYGRDVNRLALLNPQVRTTQGMGADGAASQRLTFNASSFRQTYYLLDGNANYDFVYANAPQQAVSLAGVEQVKVLTNQYTAEYGRSASGIVSTATRAGTNDFHGELFGFLRPSGMQAAPPVSSLRVPNERWQYGAAAGGPLQRDRTWFFADYEAVNQHRGSFIQSPARSVYTGENREWLALMRLDRQWNDRQSTSFRLNGNRSQFGNLNDRVGGFTQPSAARKDVLQSAGAALSHRTVLGPAAVNELRAAYVNNVPTGGQPLAPQVTIVRDNYSTEGNSQFSYVREQSWQVSDVYSRQSGRHALKAGADYSRQTVRDFAWSPFGQYTFSPGAPKPGDSPILFTQTLGVLDIRYGQTLASAFLQDEWKPLPRLSLSAGLRYEFQSITRDRNNFAPRLGFALSLDKAGKTILRGGSGLFYDQYYMYITRRFFDEGPNSTRASYSIPAGTAGFPSFPASLTAPPEGVSAGRRDLYVPGSKLLNPYTMQFSLGLERTLGSNWVVSADVIHTGSRKQMRVLDLNAPAAFLRTQPGEVRSGSQADATRPYSTYQGLPVRNLAQIENTGSSWYDALNVGVRKRFANRYQWEAHYVWASAMTYAFFVGEPNTGVPSDWGDRNRGELGPTDYHQRHRFVSSGLVELPFGLQWTCIAQAGTGLPVNPLTGSDNNGDSLRLDRPAGFGRNSFRTPALVNFDTSVSKRIQLTEHLRVDLRAEAFNLFNHGNYIRVNATYGNGAQPLRTFLQPVAGIQNSDPARQFQFMARLVF